MTNEINRDALHQAMLAADGCYVGEECCTDVLTHGVVPVVERLLAEQAEQIALMLDDKADLLMQSIVSSSYRDAARSVRSLFIPKEDP